MIQGYQFSADANPQPRPFNGRFSKASYLVYLAFSPRLCVGEPLDLAPPPSPPGAPSPDRDLLLPDIDEPSPPLVFWASAGAFFPESVPGTWAAM